jgi:hypothetical protein
VWEHFIPKVGIIKVLTYRVLLLCSNSFWLPEVALHIYMAVGLEGDAFGL